MGKLLSTSTILVLLLLSTLCPAQDPVSVSEPRLQLEDNNLHIYYDILNSQNSDLFDVSLSIKDADNNIIHAAFLVGDIGSNVRGGENKHIIWDLSSDQVEIDGDVFIVVIAEQINPQYTEIKTEKTYKRSGLILQSLLFPGWGMTRLSGKPHWIRGVAGYGCLAGSIILNRSAASNYSDFQNATSIEEANSLLETSTRQDNISEALAYTAIGVWIADIIWTMVGTAGLNNQPSAMNSKGIFIGTGFDQYSNTPLLSFTYTF